MPSIQAQLDAAFRQAIQQAFGLDADPILAVSQTAQFGKVILAIWTIANARRRGHPEFIEQFTTALAKAVKDKDESARKKLIQEVARRHQENLNSDPEGEVHFAPFLDEYRPVLDELQ